VGLGVGHVVGHFEVKVFVDGLVGGSATVCVSAAGIQFVESGGDV
jgi:hypothetical protein